MRFFRSNLKGSMRTILNRRVFPALAVVPILTFTVMRSFDYGSLAPLLCTTCRDKARAYEHAHGLLQGLGVSAEIVGIVCAAWFIDRFVTRKVMHLIAIAKHCLEANELTSLRLRTGVTEVRELSGLFNELFASQASRLDDILQLAKEIRHNVNNLLTRILIVAEGLASEHPDIRDAIGGISADLANLRRIVEINISITENYSRINEQLPERLDIGELAICCMEINGPFAAERNVSVRVDRPDSPILFVGHEQKIVNAIHNLVENAIKYTSPGGHVEIKVSSERTSSSNATAEPAFEKQVSVCVTDDGCGIEESDLTKIFERSYRAKGSHDTIGSGLGLAFVDSVARFYDGECTVKSELGRGSEFTLILRNRPRKEAT